MLSALNITAESTDCDADAWDYYVSIGHDTVKFLKSAALPSYSVSSQSIEGKYSMTSFLDGEVKQLQRFERGAIWLQTDEGMGWDCEDDLQKSAKPTCNSST